MLVGAFVFNRPIYGIKSFDGGHLHCRVCPPRGKFSIPFAKKKKTAAGYLDIEAIEALDSKDQGSETSKTEKSTSLPVQKTVEVETESKEAVQDSRRDRPAPTIQVYPTKQCYNIILIFLV